MASDPYELLTSIERVRGKDLIIISVSGKTRTNIELARKAKGIARKRIAITADPESQLANECDETLQLRYRTSGILTAGTISFATSLLACAFFIGKLPKTLKVDTALTTAERWGRTLIAERNRTVVFTGSGVNYAICMYGAAKMHEVLGNSAEVVYPEQMGHDRLFAIDKKRDVVICISTGLDKARQINGLLRKKGFKSSLLATPESNTVVRVLTLAFHMQQLALALAKKRRMIDCSFLADPERLKLSSMMIY